MALALRLLAIFSFSFLQACCSDNEQTDLCRTSYLLSVTNGTEGMEIELFPERNHLQNTDATPQIENYRVLTLPQFIPSPECGKESFRCGKISTLATQEPHRHIALVPLLNALLILDVDVRDMTFQSSFTIFAEICSPTAVFAISQSFYTVCVNSSTRHLYVYEVRVDVADITESYLTTSLAQVTLEDPPKLSNFAFADLGRSSDHQRIYFATHTTIFALTPLSTSFTFAGSIDECDSVQSVTYLGDWILLAYCLDGTLVYFDLQEGAVERVEDTAVNGQPIVCSDSDTDLRVYSDSNHGSSYIEFSVSPTKETNDKHKYDLLGTSYHSGVCFSAENASIFFAYIDSQEGVLVFDLVNLNLFQVSHEPCPKTGCHPLLVINKTYLVVQTESAVSVVFREGNNFSQEIITASHLHPELLTVIYWEHQCQESTVETPPPDKNQNSDKTSMKMITYSVIFSTVIIIIFVGTVVVIVSILILKKRRKRYQNGVPATEPSNSVEVNSLVIANTTPSLSRNRLGPNVSGHDEIHGPCDASASPASTSPEKAHEQSEKEQHPSTQSTGPERTDLWSKKDHHPVVQKSQALELVDHNVTYRTEPSSASASCQSEIEPGMHPIKTTCV